MPDVAAAWPEMCGRPSKNNSAGQSSPPKNATQLNTVVVTMIEDVAEDTKIEGMGDDLKQKQEGIIDDNIDCCKMATICHDVECIWA